MKPNYIIPAPMLTLTETVFLLVKIAAIAMCGFILAVAGDIREWGKERMK